MQPADYEHSQRLIGLMQMSGLMDAAAARGLSTTPNAVNAWRRRGQVPRAARAALRALLTTHTGLPIDDAGHVIDTHGRPITDAAARRRAVEATGCHAPSKRSHTWHTHRTVLMALTALGDDTHTVARAINESPQAVARWQRMARVPNDRMADVVSKIRLAHQQMERPTPATEHEASEDVQVKTGAILFTCANADEQRYTQAVDDATIHARLNRLITASGLRRDALAARVDAKVSTVIGWRNRRRVPPPWRAALADALSPALGLTVRADGLVADGLGGWIEWGTPCPGDAGAAGSTGTTPRALADITGLRHWLNAQMDDALGAEVTEIEREQLHARALVAMADAAGAVLNDATPASRAAPVERTVPTKRRSPRTRRATAS